MIWLKEAVCTAPFVLQTRQSVLSWAPLTTDAKSCSRNSEDPDNILGNRCPSWGHFLTFGAAGSGLVVPLGSRVPPDQQLAADGWLTDNSDSHLSEKVLTPGCLASSMTGSLEFHFHTLLFWTHTHVCFKLLCMWEKTNMSDIFVTFTFAS